MALIRNVASKRLGRKDIIKIDAEIPMDFDVIGYVDPGATVNIIRNGKTAEKKTMKLPEILTDVIKCKNPRCITTTEQELKHVFRLADAGKMEYRCIYCETRAE